MAMEKKKSLQFDIQVQKGKNHKGLERKKNVLGYLFSITSSKTTCFRQSSKPNTSNLAVTQDESISSHN
jgi:hypothetical protein